MKRYQYKRFLVSEDWPSMYEDEAGEWVRFADIQAEFSRLWASHDAIETRLEEFLNSGSQGYEKLAEAGDRLAHAINYPQAPEALQAWWEARGPKQCSVCYPKER